MLLIFYQRQQDLLGIGNEQKRTLNFNLSGLDQVLEIGVKAGKS